MQKIEGVFFHPNCLVEGNPVIGERTRIWAFVHILDRVTIGTNCNICDYCLIDEGVSIGNNVTIKSSSHIWTGVTLEDNVFVGPNVVFTNDIRPRSKNYKEIEKIFVRKGASIGANCTVVAGIEIGEYAMCGAGSVITRNVKPYALVYGNPAKQRGWVDKMGNKLKKISENEWMSESGESFTVINDELVAKA